MREIEQFINRPWRGRKDFDKGPISIILESKCIEPDEYKHLKYVPHQRVYKIWIHLGYSPIPRSVKRGLKNHLEKLENITKKEFDNRGNCEDCFIVIDFVKTEKKEIKNFYRGFKEILNSYKERVKKTEKIKRELQSKINKLCRREYVFPLLDKSREGGFGSSGITPLMVAASGYEKPKPYVGDVIESFYYIRKKDDFSSFSSSKSDEHFSLLKKLGLINENKTITDKGCKLYTLLFE